MMSDDEDRIAVGLTARDIGYITEMLRDQARGDRERARETNDPDFKAKALSWAADHERMAADLNRQFRVATD